MFILFFTLLISTTLAINNFDPKADSYKLGYEPVLLTTEQSANLILAGVNSELLHKDYPILNLQQTYSVCITPPFCADNLDQMITYAFLSGNAELHIFGTPTRFPTNSSYYSSTYAKFTNVVSVDMNRVGDIFYKTNDGIIHIYGTANPALMYGVTLDDVYNYWSTTTRANIDYFVLTMAGAGYFSVDGTIDTDGIMGYNTNIPPTTNNDKTQNIKLCADHYTFFLVRANGNVWAWGNNGYSDDIDWTGSGQYSNPKDFRSLNNIMDCKSNTFGNTMVGVYFMKNDKRTIISGKNPFTTHTFTRDIEDTLQFYTDVVVLLDDNSVELLLNADFFQFGGFGTKTWDSALITTKLQTADTSLEWKCTDFGCIIKYKVDGSAVFFGFDRENKLNYPNNIDLNNIKVKSMRTTRSYFMVEDMSDVTHIWGPQNVEYTNLFQENVVDISLTYELNDESIITNLFPKFVVNTDTDLVNEGESCGPVFDSNVCVVQNPTPFWQCPFKDCVVGYQCDENRGRICYKRDKVRGELCSIEDIGEKCPDEYPCVNNTLLNNFTCDGTIRTTKVKLVVETSTNTPCNYYDEQDRYHTCHIDYVCKLPTGLNTNVKICMTQQQANDADSTPLGGRCDFGTEYCENVNHVCIDNKCVESRVLQLGDICNGEIGYYFKCKVGTFCSSSGLCSQSKMTREVAHQDTGPAVIISGTAVLFLGYYISQALMV